MQNILPDRHTRGWNLWGFLLQHWMIQIMKLHCNDTSANNETVLQWYNDEDKAIIREQVGGLLPIQCRQTAQLRPPCLALEKQSLCVDKDKKWKLPNLIFCGTELIHWWCLMLRVFEAVASSSVKQCDQHISWGPRNLWTWKFQRTCSFKKRTV